MEYTLTLNRNQIKYEVDIESYKASSMFLENSDARYETKMSMSDADKAFFERKCREGVDHLCAVLHKFFTSCNDTGKDSDEDDDEQEESYAWEIVLTFPGSRYTPIVSSMLSPCHKYVVSYVLSEWMNITIPSQRQKYLEDMALAEAEINNIIYRKDPPTRTT